MSSLSSVSRAGSRITSARARHRTIYLAGRVTQWNGIHRASRAMTTAAVQSSTIAAHVPAHHESWTLVSSQNVTEHAAVANLYEHKISGAHLLSVVCAETEKVFGVAFRTVPVDDSGVAHVLEHSVLCGSAQFPSKEPFTELMKSSLQTYLNAMTYPDRTVYPVASPNVQDFHNLVRVYLDAVFAPHLHKHTLRQEGHHVTIRGMDSEETGSAPAATAPLVYKGVVFNEMKGVYSSGDSVHGQSCELALFPDTPYGNSSGGDPRAIPTLTYEAFTNFHADNYAPGRARLFFFGDDPEVTRLALAAAALESAVPGGTARAGGNADHRVQSSAVQRTLTVQEAFTEPIIVHVPYPAAGNAITTDVEDPGYVVDYSIGAVGGLVPSSGSSRNPGDLPLSATEAVDGIPDEHFVTVNWCLTGGVHSEGSRVRDEKWAAHAISPAHRLGVALLSHLLMGTQASTLRKTLTDSGLGSGVTGGGLDDGLLQPVFSAGLKGVSASNVAKVEPLVLHSLTMAAGMGFDDSHVASSLNTLEFQLREFASGGGPRGLALFLGAAAGWTYGRDPIAELRYADALAQVKKEIKQHGSGYFQDLLRQYLLGNAHRATVHSYPDAHWTKSRELAEGAELEALKNKLAATPGGIEAVAIETRALLEHQSMPDPPEALASIPTLSVSDLDTQQASIPFRLTTAAAVLGAGTGDSTPMLVHEQPTAGIGYASVHWDLSGLPARLVPLLPLFSWCMTSTGTIKQDEVALSRALGANTGGVRASMGSLEVPGMPRMAIPRFTLSGKALSDKGADMGHLLAEIVTCSRLDARARIVHALKDTVARHKAGIVGSGHRYAGGLLCAGLSLPGLLSEQWAGLSGLHMARSLLHAAAENGEGGLEPGMAEKVSSEAWLQAYAELGLSPEAAAALLPPSSFDELVDDLEAIRTCILTRSALHSVVTTGDAPSLQAMDTALRTLLSALPEGTQSGMSSSGCSLIALEASTVLYPTLRAYSGDAAGALQALDTISPSAQDRTKLKRTHAVGIVAPAAQVNFVAKAGSVASVYRDILPGDAGASAKPEPLSSGAEVASAVLRNGYLWDTVRVSGGAYGGFASLNRHAGTLSFASYRDPHLLRTLGAFDASGRHLEELATDASSTAGEELRKAVISTIGGIDAPLSPAERGDVSSTRWAMGLTHADLLKRREHVLGASREDLKVFAHAASVVAARGGVAAVASDRAFAESVAEKGTEVRWQLIKPLL